MGAVTTSLAEQAASIFTDLGYDVSEDEGELRAERKWRVVQVSLSEPETVPETGSFRCFVTRADAADRTRRRVATTDPTYEWAVIGVEDDGSYEVLPGPVSAR